MERSLKSAASSKGHRYLGNLPLFPLLMVTSLFAVPMDLAEFDSLVSNIKQHAYLTESNESPPEDDDSSFADGPWYPTPWKVWPGRLRWSTDLGCDAICGAMTGYLRDHPVIRIWEQGVIIPGGWSLS